MRHICRFCAGVLARGVLGAVLRALKCRLPVGAFRDAGFCFGYVGGFDYLVTTLENDGGSGVSDGLYSGAK